MDAAQQDAYIEAAEELGKSIAIGLVPVLGQAIDIYDTLESAWRIVGAKDFTAQEDAQFDMVLALIGWIPGPGDGVKKSLRLVNKNPKQFAPILFDLLRKVLEISGVETSPEALLEEILNAGKMKALVDDVRTIIESTDAYQSLSPDNRRLLGNVFSLLRTQLPAMLGIVEKRLSKWKAVQGNSSARAHPQGRVKHDKPQGKDATVAKHGYERGDTTTTNSSLKSVVASEAIKLVSDQAGIVGEHIADYYCAEVLGWGHSWKGHDQGDAGEWLHKPGAETVGKLSNRHKLFKLSLASNGQGIDSVWRASGNNEGKPYAIVEAKSEVDLLKKIPAHVKKNPSGGKKVSIVSKLGVNGIPDAEDLLEPFDDGKEASPPRAGGRSGRSGKEVSTAKSTLKKPAKIFVQMSHEWIDKNLIGAVGATMEEIISIAGYSRHLFFVATWTDAGRQHGMALIDGLYADESTHRNHDLSAAGMDVAKKLHHRESDVKYAVNKRKVALRKKYGDLSTLKEEI